MSRNYCWNGLMLLLAFLFFLSAATFSQSTKQATVKPEWVYLHSDRDIYVSGEYVHCYIQLFPASQPHVPRSSIIYLVLRDVSSRQVMQQALRLEGNALSTVFVLPDTLSSGHYELLAFTQFMRNQGEDSFFAKQLFIANRFDNEQKVIQKFHDPFQEQPLEILPESGLLLAGVECRVGVDGKHPGKFFQKKGWIIDQHGDTMSSAVFDHAAFAMFSLRPAEDKQYFLVAGDQKPVPLPEVQTRGCMINLQQGIEGMRVILHPVFPVMAAFHLQVKNPDGFSRRYRVLLKDEPVEVFLDPGEIPQGVLLLELMDSRGSYLAQRLIFHETSPGILSPVEGPPDAEVRQKVVFSSTNRQRGRSRMPVTFSVVGEDLLFNPQRVLLERLSSANSLAQIRNYLNLARGLPLQASVNDLLLAAGKMDLDPSPIASLFGCESPDFHLSGKLSDANGQAIANAMLYLSSPDKHLNLLHTSTLTDGSFHFPLYKYYHNREMYIQVADAEIAQEANIEIFDRFELRQPFKPLTSLDAAGYISGITRLQQLIFVQKQFGLPGQLVTYNTDLPVLIPQPLFIAAKYLILPSEFESLDNFQEISRELIFPLRVRRNAAGKYSLRFVDDQAPRFFDQGPLIFLDAVSVSDPADIMSLSSKDIRRIEVYNIGWEIGETTFGGILSIMSAGDHYKNITLPASTAKIKAPGVLPSHSFLPPNQPLDRHFPDFRSLLVWNTREISGEQISYDFYTGDLKGRFLVVLNAISPEGRIEHQSRILEIK